MTGDRQRLDLAERQWTRARDVMRLVERAQLALSHSGLAREPRRAGLGHAHGGLREGEAPEQVVPVGVGRQQPGDGEARLLDERRQGLELGRQHGRVDHERLVAAAHDRAGGLPELAGDDDDIGVDADRAHRRGPTGP